MSNKAKQAPASKSAPKQAAPKQNAANATKGAPSRGKK